MGQHDVVGRAAARAAALEQRGMEPAAMLVGAFEIHDRVGAAVAPARCRRGRNAASSSVKAWVEPESNQTSSMSSTLSYSLGVVVAAGSAPRAVGLNQASAPSASKAAAMRVVDLARRLRISLVPPCATKTAIGTPQARWRDITQSGRFSIMPRDAVLAGRRHPLRRRRWRSSARSRSQRRRRPAVVERLVHGDEPLRRVAEDHRLLGAPGMRILVLEPPARDERAGLDQRLDDRLVGVALLALVVDDALALEDRRRRRCRSRRRRP